MHSPSFITLPKETGLNTVKFQLQCSLPGSELLVFAFSFPKTAVLSLLLLLNLLPSLADGRFIWKPYWLRRRHHPVHLQHWYKPAGVIRQALAHSRAEFDTLCLHSFTVWNKCLFKADWGKSWHSVPFTSSVTLPLHLSRFYFEEAKIASSDKEGKSYSSG